VTQFDQGLHYHWPWPIDVVHKVSTQQTPTLRVTEFDTSPDAYAELKTALLRQQQRADVISAIFDPYLITGDKTIIHMDVTVVYRIHDPEAWLNTVSHADTTAMTAGDGRSQLFQQLTQQAMIGQVSHMKMEDALISDVSQLGSAMQTGIQNELRACGGQGQMGIEILRVEVRPRAPDVVKPAFDQVVQAKSGKQEKTFTAEANAQAAKTSAEGDKLNMITQANQYATAQVNTATGEALRFKEVWEQYKKSPETTQFNMYADAAKSVLGGAKRVYRTLPGLRLLIAVDPPQYDANQVAPPTVRPGG
jgi:membrane protease subunit HflK